MMVNTGEIVEVRAFVPVSYGPTTPRLSVVEARAKAVDWTDRVAEQDPENREIYLRAREDYETAEPILQWSRAGGGRGLSPNSRVYFLRRELRLAYRWNSNFGYIEVDANTGELLAITADMAKSTDRKSLPPLKPRLRPAVLIGSAVGVALAGIAGKAFLTRLKSRTD